MYLGIVANAGPVSHDSIGPYRNSLPDDDAFADLSSRMNAGAQSRQRMDESYRAREPKPRVCSDQKGLRRLAQVRGNDHRQRRAGFRPLKVAPVLGKHDTARRGITEAPDSFDLFFARGTD